MLSPIQSIGLTAIACALAFLLGRLTFRGSESYPLQVGTTFFIFDPWAWGRITRVRTRAENNVISSFAAVDLEVVKLTNRLMAVTTAKEEKTLEDRLQKAIERHTNLQIAAEKAIVAAAERWLLTEEGQDWCGRRGIRFP